MPTVRTKTTYLQMLEPLDAVVEPPRADLAVSHLPRPSVADYRRLYRTVGEAYHWVNRLIMPDDELDSILSDDRVEVYLLSNDAESLGYAELDRREENEVELAYFGLFPQAVGQGLGKYFLNWIVRRAWSDHPRRVWVHTCDLDHPAALPNYIKAGFEVYDEEYVDQEIVE